MTSEQIQELARDCGFEIAGVTGASPHRDFARFENWVASGKAADLHYLTDHRGELRRDPRLLLPSARSIICLGKLYNTDEPLSIENADAESGWISRYAWGADYHDVLRPMVQRLIDQLTQVRGASFESKICIDTAPLLERSYASAAGLGWIGRNTCLINQHIGSWFFLAELLVDFEVVPDAPVPDRCGTCSRCIQACPTQAIVPNAAGGFDLDARTCISYLTIEKRGPIPDELAEGNGNNLFGCDICQDVCPWNQRAHRAQVNTTQATEFSARIFAPNLAELAAMDEDEFRRRFRHSPIWRTKYQGFLRNVAIAMGNSGKEEVVPPLERLRDHPNSVVAETAAAALRRLFSVIKLSKSTADGYYR